jgi:hypothetical protein
VAPLIGSRDGLRQTVVDIMQLVRLIQTGGIPGLSSTRIYYGGQAQAQTAAFLASDGAPPLDPDGPGPVFEMPIAGPLPEELNF